ncbi:MAG: hypothetical protein J6N43_01480, partial [Prevotella sp.]|nr:hypothetical protein [Prevotella sp.]
TGTDAAPAHYWFIQGTVYVYDQYISAYTGAPNAYGETVDIPLTITAASHGTMKLLDVKPNWYAYYSAPNTPMTKEQKIVINDVEYHLNDPITYWDWSLLPPAERNLFVRETWVCIADGKVDGTVYHEGDVLLPLASTPSTIVNAKDEPCELKDILRPSNNMSHNTGYMLTYKVNNPTDWDTWYTPKESDAPVADKNQTGGDAYEDGPTYRLKSDIEGGVFGQREYMVSNLISKDVYDTYEAIASKPATGQAKFQEAYLVTQEYASGGVHLNVGSTVSKADADNMTGYVAPAFISTSTIQLSESEYIYVGARMTEAEKAAYKKAHPALASEIEKDVVPAYYCTDPGLYGGNYYAKNKNYRALEVWSSMSASDREKFEFNYDAFDVLVDPNYGGTSGAKYQYDSSAATAAAAALNQAAYSLTRPVNYTATYNGSETSIHNGITLKHGDEYSRTDFEKLPNEKRHYTAINVTEAGNVYVVNTPFAVGNTPYAVGNIISASTYGSLGTDQAKVTTLNFKSEHVGKSYYYCREEYTVGNDVQEGVEVTGVTGIGAATGTYGKSENVPVGLVIDQSNYDDLKNWQADFTIHGISPTETSTLYVSRFSDIFDLSKEKIITVIYQYD